MTTQRVAVRPVRWPLMAPTALILLASAGAAAQSLSLKEQPAPASLLCDPAPERPVCSLDGREEVEALIDEATQAMILGELDRATELLTQALEAEPCAAEAAYLRGRMAAQTRGARPAAEWFCRYLAIDPSGPYATEAARGLEQAVQEGAASDLRDRFAAGVTSFRRDSTRAAENRFTTVLDRHPVPEAFYNRGLARVALGRHAGAMADLRRYLELRPTAGDRSAVAAALETLATSRARRSPATTLALGMLLPGAGHYYTGRTGYGLIITGLVGGAAAAGLLYERTTIECRVRDPSGGCPPDDIASRETDRPLLAPALGVGAGLMVLAAIEAALRAGDGGGEVTVSVGRPGTVRVGVTPRPTRHGRAVDLQIIRFTH